MLPSVLFLELLGPRLCHLLSESSHCYLLHGGSAGLLIFTALFFGFAFFISYRESNIMASIGKILNPLFLLLLFGIFLLAFSSPLGKAASATVSVAYQHDSFFNGFLQGYNTMDALAGLAFGVTVVSAVRQLGKTTPSSNAKVTARAGLLATSAIGLIYIVLIWIAQPH